MGSGKLFRVKIRRKGESKGLDPLKSHFPGLSGNTANIPSRGHPDLGHVSRCNAAVKEGQSGGELQILFRSGLSMDPEDHVGSGSIFDMKKPVSPPGQVEGDLMVASR
jgi:hypothetical protein